jgi:uncharacterized membrane protein
MDPEWTGQARLWIIGGYLINLVASVVEFVGQFSSFTHGGLSTTTAVDVTLGPVVAASSLWTWWWLSQLRVNDDVQRPIIRNGVIGLVVVLVSEATMSFTSYTSLISIHSAPTWVLATFLLMTVGEVASAIGFLAVLLALRSRLAPTSTPTTSEDWDT